MKTITKRTAVVAVATAAATIAASSLAYAFWSAAATGSGTANAKSAATVTVSAVTGAADLYPGAAGAVSYTLTNTNSWNTEFTKVTAASVTSDNEAACPAATSVEITPAIVTAIAGGGYTISAQAAAKDGVVSPTRTIPGLVTMKTGALDGCQGKTFTVTLTLTGAQVA